MRMIKKITALFVAFAICFAAVSLTASAKENTNYLVLGDSIAEGFGIKNPDEASYGKLVADANGYNYRNRGVMGRNSERLYEYLTEAEGYIEDVEWADIISLSIGGNDFLLNHAASLLAQGIIFNDYSKFDEIGETFFVNFSKCMDRIHELNPDAVILVQTLYTSWTFDYAKKPYQQAAKRINDAIIKY
ncbi:MAG: SGNH/GDSL hydrolase family protein, partial [Acutalibacteraceae bacterium]